MILALFVRLSRGNRAALAYADEMTLSLKIETRKLQASNVELDNFAYVASHDLKSPLRGIDQLATWIGAVSYTHLDVYKRQGFEAARSGSPGLRRPAFKRQTPAVDFPHRRQG